MGGMVVEVPVAGGAEADKVLIALPVGVAEGEGWALADGVDVVHRVGVHQLRTARCGYRSGCR